MRQLPSRSLTLVASVVLGLLLTACSPDVPDAGAGNGSGSSQAPSSTAAPVPSPSFPVTGPTTWLCRPGMSRNPCAGRLDTTVIASDGTRHTETFQAASQPAFDCFYVYPTVSRATSRNAPMRVTPEIVHVVRAQAALFQRVCRLYAPVYRQVTLRGLFTGGLTDPAARALAQQDVVSAFHDYLNRFNDGRPFLLLGHSQGAMVLTGLVQTEIDGNPALRSRLVSAMLLGGSPTLDHGSAATGSFQNVPPCRSPDEVGCVVAYNTYEGAPPADTLFGRTVDGRRVICVNPAAPEGGSALLDPIVPVPSKPGAVDVVGFKEYQDSVRARCRSTAKETWLDVALADGSHLPDPASFGQISPAWGQHRVDVTIALGDLINLAARQAEALRLRPAASPS